MTSAPLDIALIGCGRVANRYLDVFKNGEISGARLVDVCDNQAGRTDRFTDAFGSRGWDDAERMLAETKARLVIVCTPSGDHAAHAGMVLDSGRHCLVEKPGAMRVEHVLTLDAQAKAKGLMYCVVKQNRYNPAMIQVKKTVESGRLGKLVLGTVRVRWMRDMSYYTCDPWRGQFVSDGGCITNQGIHHIDALQWMMGPVEAVCAHGMARLNDIEVDDTTVAIVRFANGASGAIEITTAARPEDTEASLSILGEGGTIVVGGIALNNIDTWTMCQPEAGDAEVPAKHSQEVPNGYGWGHAPLLQDIIDRLAAGNTAAPIDGVSGSKSLQLVHALYRSMEVGGWVRLDGDCNSARLGIGPGK